MGLPRAVAAAIFLSLLLLLSCSPLPSSAARLLRSPGPRRGAGPAAVAAAVRGGHHTRDHQSSSNVVEAHHATPDHQEPDEEPEEASSTPVATAVRVEDFAPFSHLVSGSVSQAAAAKRCLSSSSSSKVRKVRSLCTGASGLFPNNICDLVHEESVLGKTFVIYQPEGSSCPAAAVEASGNYTYLRQKAGVSEGEAFHEQNHPLNDTEIYKDPFNTSVSLPPRNRTKCDLTISAAGKDEPNVTTKAALRLAEIAVCDYLTHKELPLPLCQDDNPPGVAMNSSRPKCDLRVLLPPKPADWRDEPYLAAAAAVSAYSEICVRNRRDRIAEKKARKTNGLKYVGQGAFKRVVEKAEARCLVNAAGAPLAAGLQYVGEEAACPWEHGTTGKNDTMLCGDGTTCDGWKDGWNCCVKRKGRIQCPLNYPHMCANTDCGGAPDGSEEGSIQKTEHCCLSSVTGCEYHGGLRRCGGGIKIAPVYKGKVVMEAKMLMGQTAAAKVEGGLGEKLDEAYSLGFPGVILSAEDRDEFTNTKASFDHAMSQTFSPVFCQSFECVVSQMVR